MGNTKGSENSVIGNIPKAVIIFYDEVSNDTIPIDIGKKVQVQYNPSSISFSSSTDDAELKSMQGKSDVQGIVFQDTCPASTTMTVDLIFDNVNNMDAFMNEKLIVSNGSVASAQAKAKNKTYSVKQQINAFIGMITSSQTRCITFMWSKFVFCGELASVSSELTMFNVSGNPIKGKVSLSIQKKENGNRVSEIEYNMAFDKLFNGNAFVSMVRDSKLLGDKLGNLLNLNIL